MTVLEDDSLIDLDLINLLLLIFSWLLLLLLLMMLLLLLLLLLPMMLLLLLLSVLEILVRLFDRRAGLPLAVLLFSGRAVLLLAPGTWVRECREDARGLLIAFDL